MHRNRFASLALVCLAATFPAVSQEGLAPAAGSAQEDLERSLQELAQLRESIAAEKIPLSREMARLEEKLTETRRRQEETSRLQDTTSLEVGNLKDALKLRQEEMAYVSNLLDEYARGFESTLHVSETPRFEALAGAARLAPQDRDLSPEQRAERQFDLLRASLERLEDVVGGTRYEGRAVDPQGLVAEGRFAMVGPVVLFADASGKTAGLAVSQAGSSHPAVRPLEDKINAALARVVATGEGLLPLDPTRGGALRELVSRGSLVGYFKKGGPIMWPLLFVSILATTVIFERLFFIARMRRSRDPEALQELLARVEEGDVEGAILAGRNSSDFVARALTYALDHRRKSLSNALMRAAALELVRFNRGISILDTCITMAPLLGLLGTVTGMMSSFGMLGGAELSAPAQITGGIAEALIATAFGLGIAVTALIPMNYLHAHSDEARHEMEDAATHLELLMKPILDEESPAIRRRPQPEPYTEPRGLERVRLDADAALAGEA